MNSEVVVVIRVGGIGHAIARRQGSGKMVLLADFNETTLEAAAKGLEVAGHRVTTRRVDVSSRDSVHSLATAAAGLGSVVQLVHTAALSPVQASAQAVLAVDLRRRRPGPSGDGRAWRPDLPVHDRDVRIRAHGDAR